MAFTHDDNLDAALNNIKNNSTKITVCSAYPTTYTEANETYALGNWAVTSTDYTIANGDASGRKITIAQKTGGSGTATGEGLFLAHLDVTNSKLLHVTACAPKTVVTGATLTLDNYDVWEISDPS